METTYRQSSHFTSIHARYQQWLRAPWRWHLLAAVLAVVAQQVAQAWLNSWYAASGYPVPYYVGQLSFSATELEGWYAAMSAGNTLGIYWTTQFVDFAFIAATAASHFFVLSLIAKGLRGRWQRLASAMVVIGLAAPMFDVLENLASFVMLANPTQIAQPVAVLYSSFAAVKFACFVVVYLWTPVGAIAALVTQIARRVKPSQDPEPASAAPLHQPAANPPR